MSDQAQPRRGPGRNQDCPGKDSDTTWLAEGPEEQTVPRGGHTVAVPEHGRKLGGRFPLLPENLIGTWIVLPTGQGKGGRIPKLCRKGNIGHKGRSLGKW